MSKKKKFGIGLCIVLIIFVGLGVISSSTSESIDYGSDEYIEQYWKDNPDKDPCNDATSKAFGLCD